jgi:hypothetical protein
MRNLAEQLTIDMVNAGMVRWASGRDDDLSTDPTDPPVSVNDIYGPPITNSLNPVSLHVRYVRDRPSARLEEGFISSDVEIMVRAQTNRLAEDYARTVKRYWDGRGAYRGDVIGDGMDISWVTVSGTQQLPMPTLDEVQLSEYYYIVDLVVDYPDYALDA